MNRILSLAWKEWHETQAFLWIGLGCFLGLPVIGAIEGVVVMHRRFELFTSPWVMTLGSVFAVLVAVSGTCRDLAPKLEDFWRSRPIGVAGLFGIKFAVGLTVVLIGCAVPLGAELLFNHDKLASVWVVWMPFLWAATYAIAFVVGCVVRRPAHAAMLSLAGVILLYLLPVVVPALQPFSATTVADVFSNTGEWPTLWKPERAVFAAGMASLSVAALLAGLLVVWRRWHVETGQRTMYAAVASTLLLVLATAAYRLGTNLPILQQQNLEPDERAVTLNVEAGRGELRTETWFPHLAPTFSLRLLQVTSRGFTASPPVRVQDSPIDWLRYAVNPANPFIRYVVQQWENEDENELTLVVAETNYTTLQPSQVGEIPLWMIRDSGWDRAFLEVWKNRLYILGDQLVVFDLHDPLQPRLIFRDTHLSSTMALWVDTPWGGRMSIPPIPQLPDLERLRLTLNRSAYWNTLTAFDGEYACRLVDGRIEAYRLTALSSKSADFQRIGEYRPTILEKFFGGSYYGSLQLQNGLLFVTEQPWGEFNSHIDVFELRGPHPLTPVGHFGAPGVSIACPLPDGRTLIGGDKLYLVGPPPRHG